MSSPMTMFKLETMIYASEDGTNSVFTLNPALQKQLDALAAQHPEVCQRKARDEAGGDVSGQGCCAGYPACAGLLKAITDLLW